MSVYTRTFANSAKRQQHEVKALPARVAGCSVSRGANPPNRVVGVVGNQKRAIRSDGYGNRASPDVLIVYDEPGHEILVFTCGVSGLMQRYADHLIANANRPVPGAMLGRKNIPLIFRRELFAIIERQSK